MHSATHSTVHDAEGRLRFRLRFSTLFSIFWNLNIAGCEERANIMLRAKRTVKRLAMPVDDDHCQLCGNDLGMIPEGKVCCRLLKLTGSHETRTTDWKRQNEAGFTREVRKINGRTYEWTGRIWCTIRDFCHEDAFKVPGSTGKCCAKHRDFFKQSHANRTKKMVEGSVSSGEANRAKSLTKAQLLVLLEHRDAEKASLHQQLKRKHDEVEDLQVEVKRLRQASAIEVAGFDDFVPPPPAPVEPLGRASSVDLLAAFINGDVSDVVDHFQLSSGDQPAEDIYDDVDGGQGGGLSRFNSMQLNAAFATVVKEESSPYEERAPSSPPLSRQSQVVDDGDDVGHAACVADLAAPPPTTPAPLRMTRRQARLALL